MIVEFGLDVVPAVGVFLHRIQSPAQCSDTWIVKHTDEPHPLWTYERLNQNRPAIKEIELQEQDIVKVENL